jgi:hypothetical protein
MLVHKQKTDDHAAVTRTVVKTLEYTVFKGRWFKAFAEPQEPSAPSWRDGPAIWYLSDHSDAALWGIDQPLPVLAVEGVAGSMCRVMPGDGGTAPKGWLAADAAEHALAQLERRATLAWIAGRVPSPWPKTTAPGKYSEEVRQNPGFAGIYTAIMARDLALRARAAKIGREAQPEPRKRLCDCPQVPGWGTACVHVRARLLELAGEVAR